MSEAEQQTALAEAEQPAKPVIHDGGSLGYLMDTQRFEHLWRVAKAFAASALVPDHFRGKPNECFIGCLLALRLNVEPFMLMQNLYVVHGRPGMEAKLTIALMNASGKIKGTIGYRFDGEGDDYGCRAVVVDAFTGETVEGPKVDWATVKAEGWDKPKGSQVSKWRTMPEQMFRYRAASFLVKAHYPEVMMGLQSREELEDMVVDVESRLAEVPGGDGERPATKAEAIKQALEADKAETEDEEAVPPQSNDGEPVKPAEPPTADLDAAWAAARQELNEKLAAATGIQMCRRARDEAKAALPEDEHAWVDEQANAREEEIRVSRGPRSNKDTQGTLLGKS